MHARQAMLDKTEVPMRRLTRALHVSSRSNQEYRELKRQHKELGLPLGEGGTVQDLPMDEVDPNEPVYCHCQRVRVGMV